MPSPYATSEAHSTLWFEQAVYASTHIGAIAYGLHMTIYVLGTYHGLNQKKISWGWIVFNTTLFVMGTVNLATSIHFNESAWVDERNYPGGPYAFLVEQQNRAVQTVGNSASVISSTMAEGLLLYRVHVVWDHRWYITFLPVLFFLVCTALSIVVILQIALPFSKAWIHTPNFALPVWMILMVLNLVLTFLIASRLLYMRRKLRNVMGSSQYGKEYADIATLVIESALPFGILSIIFLVLFGRNDPTQNLFLPLLVQVECISPMLIILRVVAGSAWSRSTVPPTQMSSMKFATGTPSSATQVAGSEAHENSVVEFDHHTQHELQKDVEGPAVSVV